MCFLCLVEDLDSYIDKQRMRIWRSRLMHSVLFYNHRRVLREFIEALLRMYKHSGSRIAFPSNFADITRAGYVRIIGKRNTFGLSI